MSCLLNDATECPPLRVGLSTTTNIDMEILLGKLDLLPFDISFDMAFPPVDLFFADTSASSEEYSLRRLAIGEIAASSISDGAAVSMGVTIDNPLLAVARTVAGDLETLQVQAGRQGRSKFSLDVEPYMVRAVDMVMDLQEGMDISTLLSLVEDVDITEMPTSTLDTAGERTMDPMCVFDAPESCLPLAVGVSSSIGLNIGSLLPFDVALELEIPLVEVQFSDTSFLGSFLMEPFVLSLASGEMNIDTRFELDNSLLTIGRLLGNEFGEIQLVAALGEEGSAFEFAIEAALSVKQHAQQVANMLGGFEVGSLLSVSTLTRFVNSIDITDFELLALNNNSAALDPLCMFADASTYIPLTMTVGSIASLNLETALALMPFDITLPLPIPGMVIVLTDTSSGGESPHGLGAVVVQSFDLNLASNALSVSSSVELENLLVVAGRFMEGVLSKV